MAVLEILRYPDVRLQVIAKPVLVVDDAIRQLVSDMAETMYAAPGIGLAATQVNVPLQVIVVDITDEKEALMVLINPEIVRQSDDLKVYQEGCLSVPGVYDDVERPDSIVVKALNEKGEKISVEADGLLSVCIQHEIDHLKGRVFVQYLSRLKQSRIKSKMQKLDREEA
jgi:peptide deformylase